MQYSIQIDEKLLQQAQPLMRNKAMQDLIHDALVEYIQKHHAQTFIPRQRLETFRGFIRYAGSPLADDILCNPVNLEETQNIK